LKPNGTPLIICVFSQIKKRL